MSGTDERDLREALRTIREAVPTVATVDFETSDQNSYGFVLTAVTLADGTTLDGDAVYAVMDAIEQYINDISWNGVMKEGRNGYVTITVPPASDFTEQEQVENSYMADLLALIGTFNVSRCKNCGNDLNMHSIAPDSLGDPHLSCLA